jgi:hypothetical protein
LNRLNGYLKRLIDQIADAKMRRMVRELELRGIDYVTSMRIGRRMHIVRASVAIRQLLGATLTTRTIARLLTVPRYCGNALLKFLFPAWYGPSATYRPENHYMRGPGPKWRAKHLRDSVTSTQPIANLHFTQK